MKTTILIAVFAAFVAQQPRDARPSAATPLGQASLAGTIVVNDLAHAPVRAAIVTVAGDGLPNTRTVVTDDDGKFAFANLPAGRFTLSVTKPGFLPAVYGAKRPGQGGTTIPLAPGQSTGDVSIALSRGAVITGVLTDASGAPLAEMMVVAVRSGATAAPSAVGSSGPVTDDRGVYRIFGLEPGEYVVAALPAGITSAADAGLRSTTDVDEVLERLQQRARPGAGATPAPQRPSERAGNNSDAPTRVGFVPVFFPGVTASSAAQRIRLVIGEERANVDFAVALVRSSTIEGVVISGGGPMPAIALTLTSMDQVSLPVFPAGLTASLATVPGPDGRFKYVNVAPGTYTITAQSSAGALPLVGRGSGGFTAPAGGLTSVFPAPDSTSSRVWATADVTVAGDGRAVSGVSLNLQPAMRLSGQIVIRKAAPADADLDVSKTNVSIVRAGAAYVAVVNGTSVGAVSVPPTQARADGSFDLTGIVPGAYRLNASVPGATGWWLRSAIVNGRDVLDVPLEFGPTGDVAGAVLTFSNEHTELSGMLVVPTGVSASDYVVIVFPPDRTFWRKGARRVKSAQPASDGAFVVRDLPPGEYLMAALTDLDPDDADNPAFLEQVSGASLKIAIADGEHVRRDIRLASTAR